MVNINAGAKFWDIVWGIFSSPIAIFVYIALVAVIVVLLIVTAMHNESQPPRIIATTGSIPVSGVSVDGGEVKVSGKGKKAAQEEEEEDEGRSRFYMLCEIDANRNKLVRTTYDEGVTLQGLCEDFRNYACSELKLYYSIDDIRRFIAGLSVTKIMILQGMSGTG